MSRSASVSAPVGRGVAVSTRRPLALASRSDERLARLVARDGEMPFAELYERYHQALYRYCRSIVRDEHDAQDALQSAMAGAFAALRKGERDLAVRPWLFRIAHNESVSLLRRRRPLQVAADELALEAPANVSEPASVLEQRERLAALLGDLRGLTMRQRSVLVMRELSGLSIAEIAAAGSSTRGAVKQTLFEAREALRESERGRAMECEQVRRLIYEDDRRALRGRRVDSHLRACAGCAELAEAIATRRQDLALLAPPLPAAAATALLSRMLETGASMSAGAASASASVSTGAAGGAGAPSVAAHAGGTIAAKALTTAVVLVAGAAGVAGVTLSASHHAHAAGEAGSSRGAAAHHSAFRASAGSGRPGRGGPPRPHAGGDGAKRALASAQARGVASSRADGRSGEAHESPDHSLSVPGRTRAPGQATTHRNAGRSPGQERSRGRGPRSRHAAAPNSAAGKEVAGKGHSKEHRPSAAGRATEHAAHEPSARGRPKPPEEAVHGEAGTPEAPPSGHGKGAH